MGVELGRCRENNSPWKLWKWYIFTYELALTAEMIIVIYFWTFLWKDYSHNNKISVDDKKSL